MKLKRAALLLLSAGLLVMIGGCSFGTSKEEKAMTYDELIWSAAEAYDNADYGTAATALENAIKLEPTSVEAYAKLASAYDRSDREVAAAETYVRATDMIAKTYGGADTLPIEVVTLYKDAILFCEKNGNNAGVREYAGELVSLAKGDEQETIKKEVSDMIGGQDRYVAYYEQICTYQEIIGETGIVSMDEDGYWTYLTGLCFAKLVDFDNDGDEELILSYCNGDNLYDYTVPEYTTEVWSYELWDGSILRKENERLQLIYTGTGYGGDGGTTCIVLKTTADGTYLIEGAADSFECDYIRTLKDGEFVEHQAIEFDWNEEGETVNMIDHAYADREACVALAEEWWSDTDLYDLSTSKVGESDTLEVLLDTLQKLDGIVQGGRMSFPDLDILLNGELTSKVNYGKPDYYSNYMPLLEENAAKYDEFLNIYFFYDIDKDGVDELLLCEGGCEAEFEYAIYTIRNNGAVLLGRIAGGHTTFYADEDGGGHDYIYQVIGMMGYQVLNKITISGDAINTVTLSEGQTESYYSNPYTLPWAYVDQYYLLY